MAKGNLTQFLVTGSRHALMPGTKSLSKDFDKFLSQETWPLPGGCAEAIGR
jgi:hypothetical protein